MNIKDLGILRKLHIHDQFPYFENVLEVPI